MKRYWAVVLTAASLTSCRTAQPTNPFLRTTVPPPATGGVVVTPGTPYAQGISPPMVTTPAPAITPAPVTTQPVPVTPAPVAPAAPMAAPPSVAPQGDQFHPPGGSYLFHQSSTQPQEPVPASAAPPGGTTNNTVQLASGTSAPGSGGVTQATYFEPAPVKIANSMQPAGIVENPYVNSGATPQAAMPAVQPAVVQPAVARMPLGNSRGDPPDVGALAVGTASQSSTLRIVGEPTSSSITTPAAASSPPPLAFSHAPAPQTPSDTVLRITAGAPQASVVSTVANSHQPAQSTLAVSSGGGTTATFVAAGSAAQPVVQAAFQPANPSVAGADYSHSADYRSLRGRLEYSPSQRQWKLRYIPIDGTTDNFGGSVVLPDSDALKSFQPGDMVAVQGSLGESSAAGGYAPRYVPASIQLVRR